MERQDRFHPPKVRFAGYGWHPRPDARLLNITYIRHNMNPLIPYRQLVQLAESYQARRESYSSFEAELGWQDWMSNFTTAKDGEPITEREAERINAVLRQAWQEAESIF